MIALFFGYSMTLTGALGLIDVYLRGQAVETSTLLLTVAILAFGLALLTCEFTKRFDSD